MDNSAFPILSYLSPADLHNDAGTNDQADSKMDRNGLETEPDIVRTRLEEVS